MYLDSKELYMYANDLRYKLDRTMKVLGNYDGDILGVSNGEDFLIAVSILNTQKMHPLIEEYVGLKLGCDRDSARVNKGDFLCSGVYYEFKCSMSNNRINMRQIRLYQGVDYIIFWVDTNDKKIVKCLNYPMMI